MSKDDLPNYDQLLALDLKTDFPGIKTVNGVRTPKMGEVRLIHAVISGEIISGEIADYCKNLVPNDSRLAMEIDLWNNGLEELRKNSQCSSIVANSFAAGLAVNLHKFRQTALLYKNTLFLATQNMLMANLRGPSL